MDSLPQELVDAIIDNLPRSSLRSSSLVAERWRTRSQQRAFGFMRFLSEYEVDRWHSDIQGERSKILSYVHTVQFRSISSWWNEPALPGRVLKGFPSLTTLMIHASVIPDELPGQISRGEFGRGITTLYILYPFCLLSVTVSLILSLPDLKELAVSLNHQGGVSSASSVTPKTLERLELRQHTSGVSEVLIRSQFKSKYLCLGSNDSNAQRLFALSAETLVGLRLDGVWICGFLTAKAMIAIFADHRTRSPIHALISPPSFPSLTSLWISVFEGEPTHWLTSTLSSITSTPTLGVVEIQYASDKVYNLRSDKWDDVDGWLARVTQRTTVKGGPVVALRRWSFGVSLGEALLPRFRKAGGIVKIDPRR